MSNGKGSAPRPCDKERFDENYDAIFKKKPLVTNAEGSTCHGCRRFLPHDQFGDDPLGLCNECAAKAP